jgi:hypothetical protein
LHGIVLVFIKNDENLRLNFPINSFKPIDESHWVTCSIDHNSGTPSSEVDAAAGSISYRYEENYMHSTFTLKSFSFTVANGISKLYSSPLVVVTARTFSSLNNKNWTLSMVT